MEGQNTTDATQTILGDYRQYIFPAVTPFYGDHPLIVDRAKGSVIWDTEGNCYLDFFGGVLTVSVGHCNEEVTERTIRQMRRVQHTSTLYINEAMVRVARKIADLTPGRLQKCLFTNSGSEANETAIMAARMYTGNREVITLRHAYAGRTMTTMSLSGHGAWRLGGVFDSHIRHVRAPYTYRAPVGLDEKGLVDLCVQDLEETLATTTDGRIAAFMAEPIQGVGGFIVMPRDYFKQILPLVREAGGVFICDEVQTGWGRTGKYFCGIEHWGVDPDIITFAKGTANGSPIGVTIATPEIADAVKGLTFATFGGNPVTMTAALATIDYIERHRLTENAEVQGRRLRDCLNALRMKHSFVGDVRGMGLMQAMEIVESRCSGSKRPDPVRTVDLINAARKNGLLVGKGGLCNNVIRIAPHLTVTQEEMADGCSRLSRALADIDS
ncbi:MAG: aspartate aminotransferase family protein [Deltaproteobacteria bacterium]|nr:aspartate aminotransferase family protein [Deltaproteobacteria bacterium]